MSTYNPAEVVTLVAEAVSRYHQFLLHAHGPADCTDSVCDHTTTEDGDGGVLPDGQTRPQVCPVCGGPTHYTDAAGYRHDEDGSPGTADAHGCGWRAIS